MVGVEVLVAVLLKVCDEFGDGSGFLLGFIVPVFKKQAKNPLGPLVVLGFTGTYLAIPIERETDFIELFAEAFYVGFGGNGGVLSGLDGVLFGRKSERIEAHRVEYVKTGKAFVSGYNIGGDISKGMANVQTGPRGIGEHI